MNSKNKLSILLACIFFASLVNNTLGQTTTQKANHEKYWNYRERMKRYFIKIGPARGESVPANHYLPDARQIEWGDATSWLGMYYAVLAMEYKLLNDGGKPTKGTINELYYALYALNRLDDYDRQYFLPFSSGTYRDGFFMRDDVPASFKDNWTNQYPTIKDDRYNLLSVSSAFMHPLPLGHWSGGTQNEVSQDQLIDIFYGLRFVVDMIPPSFVVQPTPADAPMNLVSEAKAIVNRIMGQLTMFHSLEDDSNWQKEPRFGAHANGDVRANWILVNPVTGFKDGAGSEPRPMAYGIATTADKILGTPGNWVSHGIRHKEVDVIGDGYYGADFDITVSLATIKSSVWDNLETFVPNPFNIGVDYPQEYCLGLSPIIKSTFNSGNDLCVKTDKNFITGPNGLVQPNNALMSMYLAIAGNTWSHSNIISKANPYKMYPFDLSSAVLNGNTATNSQSFYDGLLLSAPCNGPFNYDTLSNFSPGWTTSDTWEHPVYAGSNHSKALGDFIGMDYMMLYNLYHLNFKNSSTLPSYDQNTNCDCSTNPAIEKGLASTITNNINTTVDVYRRFPTYKNYGIQLSEFITHPVNIIAGGTINNRTTLIICNTIVDISNYGIMKNDNSMLANDSVRIIVRNNGILNVGLNGTLEVPNNTKLIIQNGAFLKANGINAKIIVHNGGKLILESLANLDLLNSGQLTIETGGQLIVEAKAITTINNNSKLIIEDNGYAVFKTVSHSGSSLWDNSKLIFNQGANIQLKGNNAILELNGQLHIGDNAIFGITYPSVAFSGFIKFNRGAGVWWDNWLPGNAHITCGVNSKINLVGQTKTDKIIEINQLELYIPKNLSQFTMIKCLVEFNVPVSRMETSVETAIGHCTFMGTPASFPTGGTFNTRGLLVFGQNICIINDCDFFNLGSGLTGALFYGGNKLKVTNSSVVNCGQGITTYGAGVVMQNNNFFNNGISLLNTDIVSNSKIANNIINTSRDTTIGIGQTGVYTLGTNIIYEAKQNIINNMAWGFVTDYNELTLRCNNIRNNSVAAWIRWNSKLNMTTYLGAGFNDASNCNQFAKFEEAGSWDANSGYNSFKINDNSSCYDVEGSNILHPTIRVCPTITEGTIINFNNFNSITGKYEQPQEFNYWNSISAPLEMSHNKVRKSPYYVTYLSPLNYDNILDASPLSSILSTNCPPATSGGTGGVSMSRNHPLSESSLCSNITTTSFTNRRLQWALQEAINKMDNLQDSVRLNEATNLLIEILKADYQTPVINKVDNYLLELAYQRLFACVAQLVELHRENGGTMNPMPQLLAPRFADLITIIKLRIVRKSIDDLDYKTISDLILLDNALIYRLAEQRSRAIVQINEILANNPQIEHQPLYEHWQCIFTTEDDAINEIITTDDALLALQICRTTYANLTSVIGNGARMNNSNTKSLNDIVYTNDYSIAVYPNPTTGALVITYDLKQFKNIILDIVDMQGKKIKSYILNSQTNQFSIDNLNIDNGIYMYSIKTDGKNIMNKKIVVLK